MSLGTEVDLDRLHVKVATMSSLASNNSSSFSPTKVSVCMRVCVREKERERECERGRAKRRERHRDILYKRNKEWRVL